MALLLDACTHLFGDRIESAAFCANRSLPGDWRNSFNYLSNQLGTEYAASPLNSFPQLLLLG